MKLKKIGSAVLALVMVMGLAGCGGSSASTPLAKVGDGELTRGQLDEYMNLNAYLAGYDLSSIEEKESKAQIQRLMLEQLVSEELAKQYIDSKGKTKEVLGKDYEKNLQTFLDSVHKGVGQELEKKGISDDTLTYFYNSQAYGQALYTEVKESVSDLEQKKQAYYNEHLDAYTNKDLLLTASHILVEKEKDATDIEAQLAAGADFATLAKEKSTDTGSAAKGGDVGQFKEGEMVGEFWEASKALKVGEISAPVKSQFGYHIIQLTNRQEPGVSPYEQVQADVEDRVIGGAYQEKIAEIKKTIPVEYLDKELMPQAPSKEETKGAQ